MSRDQQLYAAAAWAESAAERQAVPERAAQLLELAEETRELAERESARIALVAVRD